MNRVHLWCSLGVRSMDGEEKKASEYMSGKCHHLILCQL